MTWSLRPTKIADPLVEMETARSIGELDGNIRSMFRWQRAHDDKHRWEGRAKLLAYSLASGLIAWGASQFRDSTTALSREQCTAVARQEVASARAEHGELRAADQRLASEQRELEREITGIASLRLQVVREAQPK